MTTDELIKLQEIFVRRYRSIVHETLHDVRLQVPQEKEWAETAAHDVRQAIHNKWIQLADSLDIKRVGEYMNPPGSCVLENMKFVTVDDPGGNWLEMTEDTAKKILVLGLP